MGYHNAMHLQVKSKKQALIMLYKLWSGFTKNLRHLLLGKYESVKFNRIGTFMRCKDIETGLIEYDFIPTTEFITAMGGIGNGGKRNFIGREAAQLDWFKIAESAGVQGAEMAKSLMQAIFAMAATN